MEDDGSTRFTVTPAVTSTALVLTIDGAIDATTRPAASADLRAAVEEVPPPEVVVVDLAPSGSSPPRACT